MRRRHPGDTRDASQPGAGGRAAAGGADQGRPGTTAIEGNTLTSEEVEQVAAGASLAPSKADQEREVRNVLDAMNGILAGVAGHGAAPAASPELIRGFHRQIGRELGEHLDAVPGQLRTDQRVVGPYRCPRAEHVPALFDLLCDWLQEEFAQRDGPGAFTSAVLHAIVAHVHIEWIHPFGDGNGRTGRLLEFYLLLRAGNPDVASHILSNFYNLTRPEYYRQLDQARRSRDLSDFVAYAVQGYRDGLLETLGRIQELQLETAWRVLVHDKFSRRSYRKKSVFKRRRELMLNVPLHVSVPLDELPTRTIQLARAYAALTEKTLVRDVQVLMDMELRARGPDTGRYRANLDLLRRRMPRRRPGAAAVRSTRGSRVGVSGESLEPGSKGRASRGRRDALGAPAPTIVVLILTAATSTGRRHSRSCPSGGERSRASSTSSHETSLKFSPGKAAGRLVAATIQGGRCVGRARYNSRVVSDPRPGAVERGVLSADTSAEIERLQIEAWRRMSPLDRLLAANALSRQVQALALAGVRHRHPHASERECFLRLAAIKLGRERTVQLYPDATGLFEP